MSGAHCARPWMEGNCDEEGLQIEGASHPFSLVEWPASCDQEHEDRQDHGSSRGQEGYGATRGVLGETPCMGVGREAVGSGRGRRRRGGWGGVSWGTAVTQLALLVFILALILGEGVNASGWVGVSEEAFGEGEGVDAFGSRRVEFNEYLQNAIGTEPRRCENEKMFCSRCENTTKLWFDKGTDPNFISFEQIFRAANKPKDLQTEETDGRPITSVNGQKFALNQYHYFEFIVGGGDKGYSDDTRRDAVYFTLVSPTSIKISNGLAIPNSEYAARKPAWDFFVGINCIPQEGNWNNQGYGNLNSNELVKSIVVNVTRDARYFIALQSRKLRYGVVQSDWSMFLSRGQLSSRWETTRCQSLKYRYPDEIASMQAEYRQTGVIGKTEGGPIPMCGATPKDLKYNVQYIYPTPNPSLSEKNIAIVVGAVCGGVVFISFAAGSWLFVRYKRTTRRMAKFSSLSRGLPDALMDGEGQEVAV